MMQVMLKRCVVVMLWLPIRAPLQKVGPTPSKKGSNDEPIEMMC
jgi:hypothetical protein